MIRYPNVPLTRWHLLEQLNLCDSSTPIQAPSFQKILGIVVHSLWKNARILYNLDPIARLERPERIASIILSIKRRIIYIRTSLNDYMIITTTYLAVKLTISIQAAYCIVTIPRKICPICKSRDP